MTPMQRFFWRSVLRGFQLICFLIVLVAFANVKALIGAFADAMSGEITVPAFCWKILPVTAPLIPSLAMIVCAELVLQQLKRPAHDPNEPWMANQMWAAKHIRLNNRNGFIALAFFFLACFGIGVPFAIASEKTPFMVIFGVFGFVLVLIARTFWLNRKWNTAELRMANVPGVIGGPFSGVAILQQTFAPGTAFEVCLKCQRTTTLRSSGHDRGSSPAKAETIWSSTIHIDKPLPPDGPNRTLVPFSFAIPFECESTRESERDLKSSSISCTAWNLVVNQKNAPSTGGAVFTVPVFRTSESSPNYQLDEDFIEPFKQEVDIEALLRSQNLVRQTLPNGGRRLSFSHWNAKLVFSISALVIACAAAIFACFWFIDSLGGAAIAALLPGVFILACLIALLDMVFWKSTIEIDGETIRCESGWHGFRKRLETQRTSSSMFASVLDFHKENGEWFQVEIHALEKNQLPRQPIVTNQEEQEIADEFAAFTKAEQDFTKLVLVKRLDGRADADALRDWLNEQCCLPSETTSVQQTVLN